MEGERKKEAILQQTGVSVFSLVGEKKKKPIILKTIIIFINPTHLPNSKKTSLTTPLYNNQKKRKENKKKSKRKDLGPVCLRLFWSF